MAGSTRPAATVRLFVNGTLMQGEALHGNLAGAVFRGAARTAPRYRLLSVHDVHPAMILATDGNGVSVAGELYDLSLGLLQRVLADEPAGLGLGVVDLERGLPSLGICWTAAELPPQSVDISHHGGWREYRAHPRAQPRG